jgi:ferredoxin-type protein NapH
MTQGNRLLTQLGFFLLQNPFLKNFITGKIYRGKIKVICSPGLNCYSCPAAAASCPIGAIQFFLAGIKSGISFYVTGFLMLTGVVFGRFICGYVCPMGLLQDLLYRIKTSKLVLRLRFLRYIKYIVLAVFVLLLPAAVNELMGFGQPWFCKYICPSGTIFAAVPLLLANSFLHRLIGAQFIFKLSIAVGIMAAAVFIYRIFCRVLCPLGAIYALFNKISIIHINCDKEKCTSCGNCSKECQIMIKPVTQPNDFECVRCGKCVNACKSKALSYKIRRTSNSPILERPNGAN